MLQDIGFLIVFESLQSNYALTISVLVLNDTVVFVKEIIVDSYQSSSSELEKKKVAIIFLRLLVLPQPLWATSIIFQIFISYTSRDDDSV